MASKIESIAGGGLTPDKLVKKYDLHTVGIEDRTSVGASNALIADVSGSGLLLGLRIIGITHKSNTVSAYSLLVDGETVVSVRRESFMNDSNQNDPLVFDNVILPCYFTRGGGGGDITMQNANKIGHFDKDNPIIDEAVSGQYTVPDYKIFNDEPLAFESSLKIYITAPYTGYGIGQGQVIYLTEKQ